MWTLVCACDLWWICFLVVELVFLWGSFPQWFFYLCVFPCEDVGQHPPKSNSCVPPALVICVWCDGVLTVLLIYSLACTSASYQCDGSFLVAFMQLCEEMLEMIGMERIKSADFRRLLSTQPHRRLCRLNLQL